MRRSSARKAIQEGGGNNYTACRQVKTSILKGMPWASFLPSGIWRRGKMRTKLDKLKAELHKFELRASRTQHSIDHGPGSEDEMGDIDVLDVNNVCMSLGGGLW